MENEEIIEDLDVRITILAPKSWHEQTRNNAKKKGLKVSAYIRQLAIEDNERLNSK